LLKKLKLFSEGGKVEPTYANMGKMIMSGGLGPLAIKKMNEGGMMGSGAMGLASMLSEGGTAGPLGEPVYASAGFRRKTVGSGGFLPATSGTGYTPTTSGTGYTPVTSKTAYTPVTSGTAYTPVTSGTSATVAPLSYTAPAPIATSAAPLASAGLPTQASDYYAIPAGQSFAQAQEHGLVENPYAWTFQNIDNTNDYYVMGSAKDDMMMVPTGGQPGVNSNVAFDNYWRAMDRAAGGDGGVGTTGLTAAGVPGDGGDN